MIIDLSFLETIEVVTGYVLILNIEADIIPLKKLVHVRGETLFQYKRNQYAFSVILSNNKHGLQMPMLKGRCVNVAIPRDFLGTEHTTFALD